MMDVEEMKSVADKVMTAALSDLCWNGSILQQFQLFTKERVELIFCDESVTNDEEAKKRLAATIRSRIKKGEVYMVLMISDTFVASPTMQQEKMRRALGVTIQEAGQLGLMEVQEAVCITLESPIYQMMVRQIYRRNNKEERIELIGERMLIDDSGVGPEGKFHAEGRFAGWFPPVRKA